MLNELSKNLLKKVENAEYDKEGIAKIDFSQYDNVEEVKAAVLEIEKIPANSDIKFDLNEGTLELALYNPAEDMNAIK